MAEIGALKMVQGGNIHIIGVAGTNAASISSVQMARVLNNTKIYYDTTANWAAKTDFVPDAGALIVYSDYATLDGENIPNFKVGDGAAYVVDLPFVSDDLRAALSDHINNKIVHITDAERAFWNNKVSCDLTENDEEAFTIVFSTD